MLSRFKLWMKSKIKPIEVPIYKYIKKQNELNERVAIITGGDGGIGFEIAKSFIEAGAKVIIIGRNETKLNKCCNELGKDSRYIVLDLNNLAEVKEKFNTAINLFGKIDILVNSAGIHIARKNLDFLNITRKEFENILNINLESTYFISQIFAKYLIKNKLSGNILFISSSRGNEPVWSPYQVSKNCIISLTEGLGKQLIKYNIVVNGIAPGPTATKLIDYKEGDSIYSDETDNFRLTMPTEVAELAVNLVSGIGHTIIGQTIYMSGGRGIIDKR